MLVDAGAMSMSLRSPRGSSLTKKAGKKSTAKCIKASIMTLVLAMIAVQFWAVNRYAKKTIQNNGAIVDSDRSRRAISPAPKIEYLMWSKEEAYMRECELHHKGNATWGKLHAPYVDKIESKNIVERMNVPSLNIIPTLAVLDKQNFTKYSLEFMKSLKQPYIIKSTHVSGGVARVFNDKYHCFKYCYNESPMPLGPEAFVASKEQWKDDLALDYSNNGNELQYRYITPRIIFEEDVISGGKSKTDVTFWWLSNGQPVFVSEQCGQPRGNAQGFQMGRVYVGADYRRLPIVFNRGTCKDLPEKPKSWNTQLEIMKQLGKGFPNEVVRIDVYGGGDKVWFSEFTWTPVGCWRRFTPAVTDGLLYEMMKKRISPDVVTPEYVEQMLSDTSWVLLSDEQRLSRSYPSPVDLCLTFEEFSGKNREKDRLFHSCIDKLQSIRKSPLRCLVSEKNGTKLHSFGIDEPVKDTSNIKVCAAKYYELSGKAS